MCCETGTLNHIPKTREAVGRAILFVFLKLVAPGLRPEPEGREAMLSSVSAGGYLLQRNVRRHFLLSVILATFIIMLFTLHFMCLDVLMFFFFNM